MKFKGHKVIGVEILDLVVEEDEEGHLDIREEVVYIIDYPVDQIEIQFTLSNK